NNIDDPYKLVKQKVEELLNQSFIVENDEKKIIEIPVCYGGEFGPDLDEVACINNLSIENVIAKHSSKDYFVYMLGFAPGFPYLAGVDAEIATPRKQTPRLKIEAGSVGIAGEQTGIYSIATPGGWQIIGRTPKKLFTPEKEKPTLLNAGEWVRFKPISEEEYFQIEAGE
ncbi:MAG: 5-oxoprolinase subunit PxpB, partial [Kurthia sp.]|nr:5-oxoprolinase subunit PxpB [Candidatus Kurthia equi]